MIKCILIYLWIYIGIYYVIEAAADADEHVHIKLHMPRGQRNTHNNNHHHHHHSHHKKRQLPVHYNSAPLPPREPPQLYHETPHNYLTAITKTTTPQHHLHHLHHTKKLPTSHLHETIGQLLEADDVFSSSSSSEVAETAASAAADTEDGDHMQYLADNFALFPQPSTSTTYETELIPHSNSHSFVAHREEADEEDNEISGPGDGSHDSELIMMEEEAENYPRHTAYAERFTSPSKTMKNEQQLLQQIYQQQQEQHQQQHNQFEQQADSMKTAKLRGNKYKKPEKEYYSEDDMTANMMMYSSMPHTTTTTMTTFAKGNNAKVDHSDNGGFKALTVDDIWSQLQRQYLNKYVPQAQPLSEGSFGDGDDGHNEGGEGGDDISLKSTPKRKRTIIRQKPKSSSSSSSANRQPTSSFWPAKSLNYDNNNHQAQNHDDNHSFHSYSTSPTLSSSPYPSTSSRNTELFDDTRAFRRPYNKFNGHNTAAAHHTHVVANEDDDDVRIQFNTDNVDDVDDDNDSSSHHHQHRDASSFEENVYQRGKKYVGNTGHVAYGNSNVNNPFNYQDLYGAFSTPITATVATKVHPSTYHPKLTRASTFSSSPASFYGDSVSPTLSHESTSYQWHTQQHNPDSYQTYHSHHQKQQQQDTHQQQHHEEQQHLQHSHPHQNQHHRFHQFQPPQSSALRLPKATITIMPSTASTAISSTFASSLSPTMSNEFTSSPATKTTQQTSRYKKRKNRIKTKKNRIVVV